MNLSFLNMNVLFPLWIYSFSLWIHFFINLKWGVHKYFNISQIEMDEYKITWFWLSNEYFLPHSPSDIRTCVNNGTCSDCCYFSLYELFPANMKLLLYFCSWIGRQDIIVYLMYICMYVCMCICAMELLSSYTCKL